MVKLYIHPKLMKNPNAALVGEVIVFPGPDVREAIIGLNDLLQGNSMCEELNLKDALLFIPRFQTQMVVASIVDALGDIISDYESARPILMNFIKTELLDSDPINKIGNVSSETSEVLLAAIEHLVQQILKAYDITHSRDDGRYGFELLKLATTGTLVVSRSRLDY